MFRSLTMKSSIIINSCKSPCTIRLNLRYIQTSNFNHVLSYESIGLEELKTKQKNKLIIFMHGIFGKE